MLRVYPSDGTVSEQSCHLSGKAVCYQGSRVRTPLRTSHIIDHTLFLAVGFIGWETPHFLYLNDNTNRNMPSGGRPETIQDPILNDWKRINYTSVYDSDIYGRYDGKV
jgi:hypothetical protein